MKAVIENSVYLIVMVLICLLSIDFVSMNMGISKVGETEQYVEDYIELYGQNQADNTLDSGTISAIEEKLKETGMTFSYEYMESTRDYAYYKIQISYDIRTRIFNLKKKHTFDGLARTDI